MGNKKVEVLSIPFVKKYIQYAKSRIKPVLTAEASERISEIYVSLRNDDMQGNQRKTSPMTVRTLETIIRLSTAHAKSLFSRKSSRMRSEASVARPDLLRICLLTTRAQMIRTRHLLLPEQEPRGPKLQAQHHGLVL